MNDRDAFHVAKLMLFNTRLLNRLQCERFNNTDHGRAVSSFVSEEAQANGLRMENGDSVIHQGTFIGMAYVALVWLMERFDRIHLSELMRQKGAFCGFQAEEPRAQNGTLEAVEYLRLVRNAISHG